MSPLSLDSLSPASGSTKKKLRVGRGLARRGTYSGRGVKGQRARSGGRAGLRLKGLRSLMLKLPKKRGVQSEQEKMVVVNLGALARAFVAGDKITPARLRAKGLVEQSSRPVKILADGLLSHPLHVSGCAVSNSAKTKIEAVGGSVKAL